MKKLLLAAITHWTGIVFVFLFSLFVFPSTARDQNTSTPVTTKDILVLFGTNRPDNRQTLDLVESEMRKRVPGPITFHETYLPSFDTDKQYKSVLDSQAETYRRTYAQANLNLVIAVYSPAVDFATRFRDKIFPGVPIMFAGVGVKTDWEWTGWPGVPGVTFAVGLRETIDLALKLHPDTKRVAIVGGPDWNWIHEMHSELSRHNVEAVDIISLYQSRDMVEKVAALGPHTMALLHTTIVPTRSEFGSRELIRGVSETAPTYSVWEYICIDFGCIGGAYANDRKIAAETADIAARILSGEKPESIPVVPNTDIQATVDWRALQRWHVPDSRIPPGTLILYREPTLWERGRKYFLAFIGVILVEGLLILGLFWQRAKRRKTEQELRESEEKFSKSFRHSSIAVSMSRVSDSRYIEVNEAFEEQTGWNRSEVVGRTVLEINLWADPEQRLAFRQQLQSQGYVHGREIYFRRRDGQLRAVLLSAELIEVHGVSCALAVGTDITERKEAEEVLSSVSQRLIEAQEKERTRIARELHDDVSQRLSVLVMQLLSLQESVPESETVAKDQIEEAIRGTTDLADDVQALSHRLHSSKLEILGLTVAAESFCKELSVRQNVEIEIHSENVPRDLSPEISLCLFRVLQESVQNAAKYSGVRQFAVNLEATPDEVWLSVHDSGSGFDPKLTANRHGLGLISMTERLKSVEGQLVITSKPGEGTTILARVPLVKLHVAASASK
jgi:PAS domain S-box-containing protein